MRVTGARLYPTAVLEALVADLNGGTRTLADLSRGAARITRFYRAQGWPLASAYLPAQSIRDGQVEIRVMEGTLSGVRIQADPQSRLRASVIDAHLAALEHDAPLNQAQVDRALLLLSDLAGASLNASLAAGAHPGQTELVIGSRAALLTSGRLRPTTTVRSTRDGPALAEHSTSTAPRAMASRSARACWRATTTSITADCPCRCRWGVAA